MSNIGQLNQGMLQELLTAWRRPGAQAYNP